MKAMRYETYDLPLAAYLVASGSSQLTDIVGSASGNGHKLFCFDPAPSKEELIRFYSGQATVSARRFAEAFATLKSTGFTLRGFD